MNPNKNFIFWFGVVEDRMDPLELGRVRVRVLNYHPENVNLFPTEKLPWATVLQPTTSASMSGKGVSAVGLVEGSWVAGIFADGDNGQLPVVIGSLTGMNEEVKSDENFGDGFRDRRPIPNPLSLFPVDEFNVKQYPDGKLNFGDRHGAQIQNAPESKKYPRENYSAESSGRDRGTPDLNILAIGDMKRIDKTIVDAKRKAVESGLRDIGIDVADCKNNKFTCGVVGLSGANKGTIKALGGNPAINTQKSSSFPSRKTKYRQFVDKPTNNNAIRVDSAKTMDLSQNTLLNLNFNVSAIADIGLA